MTKKIVLYFLLLQNFAYSSIKEDLLTVVRTKNIDSLEYYFKKNKENKDLSHYWKYQRTLIADYYEGICEMEHLIPDKDNPAVHSIYTYVLQVIYQGNKMIHYRLSEEKNRKENKEWFPYLDPYDTYTHDSLYKELELAFQLGYMSKFDPTELFLEHIVFGSGCGFVGIDPEEKTLMDNYANKYDAVSIYKWMQSTNTEKQLYGLYGITKMIKSGYKPSSIEEKIMENIRKKKGTVRTCSGCIFGVQPINYVFARMNQMF